MVYGRSAMIYLFLFAATCGCTSSKLEKPSQEQIKKQVERDAAMRAAEDKATRETKK
jgi:hypothetical protein